MKEICPKVLIISNQYDFSTDFVCVELERQNVIYWRINRDELEDYEINFDPIGLVLIAQYRDIKINVNAENLISVYYRAPTFLRDIYQDEADEEEQLKRTQWAAFVRSLCVFENAKWVNNPVDTYKAEIKAYQLFKASQIGFLTPKTTITNKTFVPTFDHVAIKTIDTAIINLNEDEGFVYTELYNRNEIVERHYKSPFFLQQGMVPKIDIRVTVADDDVIAAKILTNNALGIDIDWRRLKEELKYEIFQLPKDIENLCRRLVRELKLSFGGIDLVLHNDQYYFIEINPTGEWSWLQQNTGYRYDQAIVKALCKFK
jgi:hypothetical protein